MYIKKHSTHITNIKIIEFSFSILIIVLSIFNPVYSMEFEIDKESFILGDNYTNLIFESSNEDKKIYTNVAIDLLLINSLIEMTENKEIDMEDLIEGEPLVNHIRNLIYYDKESSKNILIKYFTEEKLLKEIKNSYIYNKMINTKIYSLKEINKNSTLFEYEHNNMMNETTIKDLFILTSYILKENEVLNNLFEQKGYYSKKDQIYIKNTLPKKLTQNIKTIYMTRNDKENYNYILKCKNLIYIVENKKDFENACNSLLDKNPGKYRLEKDIYDEKYFNISKIPFINRKAEVCESIYIPSGCELKKKLIIDKNYNNNTTNKDYIGYLNLYNKDYSFFYPLKKVR